MRPLRCLLTLGLVLSCTSNSAVTTDPGCLGFGCRPGGGDGGPSAPDGGPGGGEQQTDQVYETNPIRDIDLLFMVDNSPSMKESQVNLQRNFTSLLEELKKLPGGLPNLHIGVVSSDLGAGSRPLANGGCPRPGGDRGIFQTKPDCHLDASSRFISSFDNQTHNNFSGSIETTFGCMANVGVQGCGYEHQLQATRVALYESITPENKGFLRQDALLAIVLLTDEDDCSASTDTDLFVDDASFPMTTASFRCSQVGHLCNGAPPPISSYDQPLESCTANDNQSSRLIKVQEIVESIKALKRRPDQILVSGIVGWPHDPTGARYRYTTTMQGVDVVPICQSQNGEAAVGLRLKAFVDSFGASGSLFSICTDDFAPIMKQIGQKLAGRLGNMCLKGPLADTSPEPGVQPNCQVVDRIPAASGFRQESVPPCSSGARSAGGACWILAADASCEDSGLELEVDRAGQLATPGTQVALRCVTCSQPSDPRCRR
jgi:hypothetical protein